MSRKKNQNSQNVLKLKSIQPITQAQHEVFKSFDNGKNQLLHGYAGTGKSFISLYLALRELEEPDTTFSKIFILRSAVSTRDLGFMPGSVKEKIEVYEAPYIAICAEITNKTDAYLTYKQKDIIEFLSTSYIRGTTFDNCILVIDEIQNMDYHELSSIITRLGKNCRVMFCGDFRQTDFRKPHEEDSKDDVKKFMHVISNMTSHFDIIEFGVEDIIRNKIVKDFIIQSEKLGYT